MSYLLFIVCFILILLTTMVFLPSVKQMRSLFRRAIVLISISARRLNKRIITSYHLFKSLKNEYHSNSLSIELIFFIFCNFYEKTIGDSDHWALDEENFPNGLTDITNMYIWIKEIRMRNYHEVNNVSYLLFKRDNKDVVVLRYYNQSCKKIKIRINKIGYLVLSPDSKFSGDISVFDYDLLRFKVDKILTNLDNMKASWILERRRFFGI